MPSSATSTPLPTSIDLRNSSFSLNRSRNSSTSSTFSNTSNTSYKFKTTHKDKTLSLQYDITTENNKINYYKGKIRSLESENAWLRKILLSNWDTDLIDSISNSIDYTTSKHV